MRKSKVSSISSEEGFELAFSSLIPKEEIEENDRLVREVRSENWSKCLEKAEGDLDKAVDYFGNCDF